MSIKAVHWALSQKHLKPSAWIVLIKLADRHNPDYGCFPSLNRLADDCNMSRQSVLNQLKTLESMGLVKREHRRNKKGETTSNLYHLQVQNFDHPSQKSVPTLVKNFDPNLVSNNLVSIKAKMIEKYKDEYEDMREELEHPEVLEYWLKEKLKHEK